MIVIADTSPLHYLILLEHADVLQHLYGRVIIPEAVVRESSATTQRSLLPSVRTPKERRRSPGRNRRRTVGRLHFLI